MATAYPATSHPVRGSAPGSFEQVDELRWAQLDELAHTLRPLACWVLSRSRVEGLVQRFGVDRSTIYRYRARLLAIDETVAIAGHKRGWKPLASRLSLSQEQCIEQAIKVIP